MDTSDPIPLRAGPPTSRGAYDWQPDPPVRQGASVTRLVPALEPTIKKGAIELLSELIEDIKSGVLSPDGVMVCLRLLHPTDPTLELYTYRNVDLSTLEAIGLMRVVSSDIEVG